MKFIDSHHHLWDLEAQARGLDYGWLRDIGSPKPFGDPTPIQRSYLAPEFRLDAGQGLLASVHVQCDPGLSDPVAETAFISAVQTEFGFPQAIVGFADLTKTDLTETLDRHQAYPLAVGIRQIVAREPSRPDISFRKDDLLADPSFQAGLAEVARRGLSFDLQLYPGQMQQAAELLARHPNMPVIIDHAGSPFDQTPEGLAVWEQGLEALAALPNTSIKLSGFGMYDRRWSLASSQMLFLSILGIFGPQRIMLGSNYPVDKLMKTYADITAIWAGWLEMLPVDQQEAIAWRNAARVYKINL